MAWMTNVLQAKVFGLWQVAEVSEGACFSARIDNIIYDDVILRATAGEANSLLKLV